jgi:glycerol-3-phosphate dehydrogenase
VCKKLGRPVGACSTHRVSLPGGKTDNFAEFCNRFRTDASLPSKSADRLLTVYGTRAPEVLALCEQNGDALVEPFDAHTGAIGAEILFAFRNEFAQTLSDALIGRTMVGYDSAFDPRSAVNAARIAQQHLGWDDHRAADELEAYHQYIERFNPRSSRQTMAVAEHRCPNEEQRI